VNGTSDLPTTTSPHPGATPQEWYTSQSLLDLERRRLFDHSWSLVGTTEQLAETGSYLTATVGTSPLVVLRDEGGVLRSYHNICRHRGAPLVEGSGRCGRFLTCPYHQWSYQLDGVLRRAPQSEDQFPDMDASRWGLHPAAVGTWHGMVFANPDPDAPALTSSLGDLAVRLEHFLSGPLVEVACTRYTAACNWKLLVENHVDVYHLWYLHSRSLAMYDHRQFHWDGPGDNWWSMEPLKDSSGLAPGALAWLSQAERDGIGAHLLFPNTMLVTTGHYFASYDAVPLTPGSTLLTLRVRSTAEADAGGLVAGIRSFMAEDVDMCERLQLAAGAARFGLGPLARTHERPVRAFHAAVARTCHD
jgi:phenylpropionate dioxygenase-like ring-hydroxylating dioxygenase large terminal subunit